jgi:outer membrane protein assembly factor BamB
MLKEILMRLRLAFVFLFLSMLTGTSATGQSQWGQFRGPGGSGIAPDEAALPALLNESNLKWKSAIPHGLSSPCISGNRIFLTGMRGTTLETFCIDRKTGEILWRAEAWYEFIERVHRSNSPASPTAVTDGERVYVYIGSAGIYSYDFEGQKVWERVMFPPPTMYGTASSLILAKGLLIFCNDNERSSTLEAINPADGETVWRKKRPEMSYNWTTPMFWVNDEVDELVVNGFCRLDAYGVADGEKRWTLPGLTPEPCVTPVAGDGLIYVTSYNMKTNTEVIGPPPWAELLVELDSNDDGTLTLEECKPNKSILSRADADGEGDHPLWGFHRRLDEDKDGKLTEEEWQGLLDWVDSFPQMNAILAVKPPTEAGGLPEIVWQHKRGVPEVPSPLYLDGRVYTVKNGGIVTCLDGRTGEVKYYERLDSGGPYYASLVTGDGKIYAASTRGVVTVFEAGDELKVLARNDLGERISATPALLDGVVYVRTDEHMYAFGSTE